MKKKKFNLYNVKEVKLKDHEIILKVKDNHFFNYVIYLDGLSGVEVVKKIIEL